MKMYKYEKTRDFQWMILFIELFANDKGFFFFFKPLSGRINF